MLDLAREFRVSGDSPTRRIVRFGVFEMDPEQRELRRSGLKVKLQDQPFQLLAVLLERAGELVTREQLRSELWPADTFVDFDHSLNAAIKRLRDALGDDPENPRFIETVPRRGYRFLADISKPRSGQPETAEHRPTAGSCSLAFPFSWPRDLVLAYGYLCARTGRDALHPCAGRHLALQ